MWARMAKVAQDKIAASGATPYLSTKLVTGRFFMERMLPETTVHLARIQTGCATTMELAGGSVLTGEFFRGLTTIRDSFPIRRYIMILIPGGRHA